jgi:hypothetical protein
MTKVQLPRQEGGMALRGYTGVDSQTLFWSGLPQFSQFGCVCLAVSAGEFAGWRSLIIERITFVLLEKGGLRNSLFGLPKVTQPNTNEPIALLWTQVHPFS